MEQHEYSHFVRFPAAEACVSYISGTFHNDRFLPCDAEFGLVYGNPGKKGEGNFKAEDYRSSTEDTTEDNTTGMRQSFRTPLSVPEPLWCVPYAHPGGAVPEAAGSLRGAFLIRGFPALFRIPHPKTLLPAIRAIMAIN